MNEEEFAQVLFTDAHRAEPHGINMCEDAHWRRMYRAVDKLIDSKLEE